MSTLPKYLKACLFTCRRLSFVISVVHYRFIQIRLFKIPGWFDNNNTRNNEKLFKMWYTRITKRFISVAVRSFARRDVLKMVNGNALLTEKNGCIIAICHTPWKRLLLQWCIEQKNILVVANAKPLAGNCNINVKPEGYHSLKKLVTHLHNKAYVAVTIDCFNSLGNCNVDFLGSNCNASTFPARLSRLANVPLITAIPVFKQVQIEFIKGPGILLHQSNSINTAEIMKNLVGYLDNEIRNEPSIWSEFVNQKQTL